MALKNAPIWQGPFRPSACSHHLGCVKNAVALGEQQAKIDCGSVAIALRFGGIVCDHWRGLLTRADLRPAFLPLLVGTPRAGGVALWLAQQPTGTLY